MDFDSDEFEISDGFDEDGKSKYNEENDNSQMNDMEKQELYFNRRQQKKEAEEKINLLKKIGKNKINEENNKDSENEKHFIKEYSWIRIDNRSCFMQKIGFSSYKSDSQQHGFYCFQLL